MTSLFPEGICRQVADAIGLQGRHRDILMEMGTLFIENGLSDGDQQRAIYDLLHLLPPELRDCEVITIRDYMDSLNLEGAYIVSHTGVNVFGIRVGSGCMDEWPSDSAHTTSDCFTVVAAHEVNHTVDGKLGRNPQWLRRKFDLIEQAAPADVLFKHGTADNPYDLGVDWTATRQRFQSMGFWGGVEEHWNNAWDAYWQTGGGQGYDEHWLRNNLQFMCEAPNEAIATLANQYFADGAIMFDLALRRWNRSIRSCINQVLFFADCYSQGQDSAYFYRTDCSGNITRWVVPLTRDLQGHISSIEISGTVYVFGLDANGYVTGIEQASDAMRTLSAAKLSDDNLSVYLPSVIVTAVFSDFFYVESDDRSAGIRVNQPGHCLVVGDRVRLIGTTQTSDEGERLIAAVATYPFGTSVIRPLGMPNCLVGGGDFGAPPLGQLGVKDGLGLNNIGLLVTTWGNVTAAGRDWFYVDDGSGVQDGTGILGSYCEAATGITPPSAGSYVAVTGISGCEFYKGNLANLLRVRSQEDINIISLPLHCPSGSPQQCPAREA